MALNIEEIKLEVEKLKKEAELQRDWEKKKKILKKIERLVNKVINEHGKLVRSGEYKNHDMEDRFEWGMDILGYLIVEFIDS